MTALNGCWVVSVDLLFYVAQMNIACYQSQGDNKPQEDDISKEFCIIFMHSKDRISKGMTELYRTQGSNLNTKSNSYSKERLGINKPTFSFAL